MSSDPRLSGDPRSEAPAFAPEAIGVPAPLEAPDGSLADTSLTDARHLPGLPPVAEQYLLGAYRIRRCTFRRMTEVAVPEGRIYDVECLFPDRRVAIPLGDLAVATPICNACTALHIFRPDED